MYRFSLRYILIVFVGVFNRAVLYAGSTTRAFVLYDISGLFIQCYGEVSFFPFYTFNISIGKDFNVRMPADLGQFW